MSSGGHLKAIPAAVPIANDAQGAKPSLKHLLKALVKHGASDLHIKGGRPPMYRVNGKLVQAKMPALEGDGVRELIQGVLTPKHWEELERRMQVDLSFRVDELGRFRANIYMQRGTLAAVIRLIPLSIPSLESLNLPTVLKELVQKKRGLFLVTGATGAGKSTTMAAMLNYINEHTNSHIVMIEDPIEFVFRDLKSSVCQREVGTDTPSMQDALIGALRQDPDVISIGELRNAETIQTALTAAETGHLVISTLHTSDARTSIDRIIDVFPAEAKSHVRLQLANSLLAVVSQKLVTRADGGGRLPVCEVLIKSPTIENIIMKNELDKLNEAMNDSAAYYKMQTLNQALEQLVEKGAITPEEAVLSSNAPEDLRMRLLGFKKEEGF